MAFFADLNLLTENSTRVSCDAVRSAIKRE